MCTLISQASENGYITVFDTQDMIKSRAEPKMLATIPSSRPFTDHGPGAVRVLKFIPSPWDLLVWAESQARVCVADLRNLQVMQVVELNPDHPGLTVIRVVDDDEAKPLMLRSIDHDDYTPLYRQLEERDSRRRMVRMLSEGRNEPESTGGWRFGAQTDFYQQMRLSRPEMEQAMARGTAAVRADIAAASAAARAASNSTNGANGTNGTNGTSRTNGTSGTNGTNGANGTSATNGTSGTNGTSITNGTSGTNDTNVSNTSSGAFFTQHAASPRATNANPSHTAGSGATNTPANGTLEGASRFLRRRAPNINHPLPLPFAIGRGADVPSSPTREPTGDGARMGTVPQHLHPGPDADGAWVEPEGTQPLLDVVRDFYQRQDRLEREERLMQGLPLPDEPLSPGQLPPPHVMMQRPPRGLAGQRPDIESPPAEQGQGGEQGARTLDQHAQRLLQAASGSSAPPPEEGQQPQQRAAPYLELLREQARQQEQQQQALQMLVQNRDQPGGQQQQEEEYERWRQQVLQRYVEQGGPGRAPAAVPVPAPPQQEAQEEVERETREREEQRLQQEEEERQRSVQRDREARRRHREEMQRDPERAAALAALPALRAADLAADRERRQLLLFHQQQLAALGGPMGLAPPTAAPATYVTPEMLAAIPDPRTYIGGTRRDPIHAARVALIPHPSTADELFGAQARTTRRSTTPPVTTTSQLAAAAAPPNPRAWSPPRIVPRRAPLMGPGLSQQQQQPPRAAGDSSGGGAPQRAPAPGASAAAMSGGARTRRRSRGRPTRGARRRRRRRRTSARGGGGSGATRRWRSSATTGARGRTSTARASGRRGCARRRRSTTGRAGSSSSRARATGGGGRSCTARGARRRRGSWSRPTGRACGSGATGACLSLSSIGGGGWGGRGWR